MNAIGKWIDDHPERFFTPTTAMDVLQENGIVSDNALTIYDVAEADHARAVAFLDSLN